MSYPGLFYIPRPEDQGDHIISQIMGTVQWRKFKYFVLCMKYTTDDVTEIPKNGDL